MTGRPFRIAAAQAHGAWGRPAETARRAIEWLGRAAAEEVGLLAFGETYLGGYPFWLALTDGSRFEDPDQKRAHAYYLDAAVELDGPDVGAVVEAARDLGVFTYLGIAERGPGPARGTVFCTLVAIDPERGIVSAHRKLQPTYEERLAWGQGDGHGLRVHALRDDLRVGGLNCWENWMPLARTAMYAGGEDVHVAAWPGAVRLTESSTRFIAREGRVYCLSASVLLSVDDVAVDFPLLDACRAAAGPDGMRYDGGSAIAGPDGEWVVAPVAREERLVVADIDPARVREERQNFDPTGHYSRPDVLELRVDRRRLHASPFRDG